MVVSALAALTESALLRIHKVLKSGRSTLKFGLRERDRVGGGIRHERSDRVDSRSGKNNRIKT